jgi:elongation factor 3
MENVNFRYPGQGKDQLTGVTIKMNLSSRVALLGANGAGKTTVRPFFSFFFFI